MTAPGDDREMMLVSLIPSAILEQIGPTELQARIKAGRQILADQELNESDRSYAVHQVKKLMESIPLRSFFAAASLAAAVPDHDAAAGAWRDIRQLAKHNPAIKLFYDGLGPETQAAIVTELYSAGEAVKPRRRRLFWRNK